MSNANDWVVYSLDDAIEASCMKYTKRMLAGPNPAAKMIRDSRPEAYRIGKLGEWAVGKWAKDKGVPILHHPFRESYQKFHSDDDFIFELLGEKRQIEVRTKARSVAPQGHYNYCSDKILPHLLYVFVSYDKSAREMYVLGWADWDVWRKNGKAVIAGKENSQFRHKSNEFTAHISSLGSMDLLLK